MHVGNIHEIWMTIKEIYNYGYLSYSQNIIRSFDVITFHVTFFFEKNIEQNFPNQVKILR